MDEENITWTWTRFNTRQSTYIPVRRRKIRAKTTISGGNNLQRRGKGGVERREREQQKLAEDDRRRMEEGLRKSQANNDRLREEKDKP